jgi:hypothetical protein
MNCECGGKFKHVFTGSKDDQIVKGYACEVCGKSLELMFYKYSPSNCPKHQWEFIGWGFKDSMNDHAIYWKMQCDRCGKIEHVDFSSQALGLRQAVQVENPEVLQFLELTDQTARFLLDDDDVKNFWE